MKNLTEAIKTTVYSQLEYNQEVHPRMIEAVVREQYGDLIKEHGEVLAYRALLRQIKSVLKSTTGETEKSPFSQLSLPGLALSIAITNKEDGGDGFVYIRWDKATWRQLTAYKEILQENILNAIERKRDLEVKMEFLQSAFEYNPLFTVSEACEWVSIQKMETMV